MKMLRFFENGIHSGLKLTRTLNEKVGVVKSKNIRISAKILLSKQKMKNLLNIYDLMKIKINNCYNLYKETKQLKKQNKFSALFFKIRQVLTEIESITKKLEANRKLAILETIKEKSKKKMFKLTTTVQSLFSNLFISRKPETYDEIFLFYLNQGNYIEVLIFINH